MSLKAGILALRLEFRPRDWDLRKSPICVKAQVIDPFGAAAQKAVSKVDKIASGRRGDQMLTLDTLKTLISFCKKSLRKPFPAKLGAFSQAGRAFSVAEMTQKLKDIIKLAQKDKEREERQSALV